LTKFGKDALVEVVVQDIDKRCEYQRLALHHSADVLHTVKTIADESNDLFGITHMHSKIRGVHGGFVDDNFGWRFLVACLPMVAQTTLAQSGMLTNCCASNARTNGCGMCIHVYSVCFWCVKSMPEIPGF